MADKLFKNNMPKIPEQDERWNSSDSLGVKIEKVFTRFIQRVTLWGWEFFAELMVQIFDASMKILQPGMTRMSKPLFDKVRTAQGMPEWFTGLITAVENEQGESKVLGQLAVFASLIFGVVGGGLAPLGRIFSYSIDKNARTGRAQGSEAVELWRRGVLDETAFSVMIEDTGTPEVLKEAYIKAGQGQLNPMDTIFGLWRGLLTETQVRDILTLNGVDKRYHDLWIEKSRQIPPVQDLIRFMVRDTFKPQVVEKYGYGEEYPDAINEFLKKQGYSPEWGEHYWKAHWNLPSPNQVFEMLQRGIIDRDTMLEYLKVNDYPKFWRDALAQISYNLYTRVDVRRLLQAGMLTDEEAFKAYKEMGYDEVKARKLTDFAVKGISQDEKDLTKTDVLNLYEEGLIDRSETSTNLVKMGYDQSEADNILKLSDVNIAKAARTDAINYVKEKFQARTVDEAGARNELSAAGLKAQSVDRYLMAWKRINENDVTLPSKADVKGWFMNDYIDETKLRDYLKRLKYGAEEIDIYVKDYNNQKGAQQNAQ